MAQENDTAKELALVHFEQRPHARELYAELGLDLSDDEFTALYSRFMGTALTAGSFAQLIRVGVDLEKRRQHRYDADKAK